MCLMRLKQLCPQMEPLCLKTGQTLCGTQHPGGAASAVRRSGTQPALCHQHVCTPWGTGRGVCLVSKPLPAAGPPALSRHVPGARRSPIR